MDDGSNEVAGPPPPLKWVGGKRWLVPTMRQLWAPHRKRRFVEPMCGGLAVTLGLSPESALLNDINVHLINLYRWMGLGLRTDVRMCNVGRLYYRHRARFNRLIRDGSTDTKEAAELFYFLNRTGFNGLCRFNREGRFNVAFGRHKTIAYRSDFAQYKKTFSNWTFVHGDFESLDMRQTDFIYADPPYDVEFTKYSKEGFCWDDQVRLARWLSAHRGPIVVSNQATDRVSKLYRSFGFHLTFLDAPRRVSCDGNRTAAREILATRGI